MRMVALSSNVSQRQATCAVSTRGAPRDLWTYQIGDQAGAAHLPDRMLGRLGLLLSVDPWMFGKSGKAMRVGIGRYRVTNNGTKETWMLKNDESGSRLSWCLSCTSASTKGPDSRSLARVSIEMHIRGTRVGELVMVNTYPIVPP